MFLLWSHGFSICSLQISVLFVLMRVEISLFSSGMLGSCGVFLLVQFLCVILLRMACGRSLSVFINIHHIYHRFRVRFPLHNIPLHNIPSTVVLMKNIGAGFLRPNTHPDVNYMHGMQYPKMVLNGKNSTNTIV